MKVDERAEPRRGGGMVAGAPNKRHTSETRRLSRKFQQDIGTARRKTLDFQPYRQCITIYLHTIGFSVFCTLNMGSCDSAIWISSHSALQ